MQVGAVIGECGAVAEPATFVVAARVDSAAAPAIRLNNLSVEPTNNESALGDVAPALRG